LNGQEIEAPRVDNGRRSQIKDAREKEITGDKHRQNSKAN
jgi:hypothetical protein